MTRLGIQAGNSTAQAGAEVIVADNSAVIALALDMHDAGCSLIPVGRDKKPCFKWQPYQRFAATPQQLERWAKHPKVTGFALVCGKVSGNVEVIDFDDPTLFHQFMAALPDWAKKIDFPIQLTGGGGYQLAYRRAKPGRNQKLAWSPAFDADGVKIEGREIGIETRGEGGYAVIPHSLHPSGNLYQLHSGDWTNFPKQLTAAQADELLDLARSFDQTPEAEPFDPRKRPEPVFKGSFSGLTAAADAQRKYADSGFQKELDILRATREGGRNDQLNKSAFAAGQLVGAGLLDEATARHELEVVAREIGLEADEIRATINSGMTDGKADPRDLSNVGQKAGRKIIELPEVAGARRYHMPTFPQGTRQGTDEANAVILASNGLALQLRYTPGLGWFVYDLEAGVWHSDPELIRAAHIAGEVLRTVVGQHFADSVEQRVDERELKQISKWATQVCNVGTVARALQAAAGKNEFLTAPEQWDAHKVLLNCRNGVLDLASGTLLPHDPQYLMTWQAGADFDPAATHPYVDQLTDLLKQDGRHDFLQRTVGSTLYGEAPNETITVLDGEGGTGKGTLTDATVGVLGDYAGTIDVNLLLSNPRGEAATGPKPELLMLRGKRLVVAGEPAQGARWNAGRVKGMSGNDPITARNMHSPAMVTFTPVFKLWIHTNYPIGAAYDDSGMQRRLRVVPFRAKPAKANPDFKRTLKNDPVARSALLNWALEGCQAWLASGYDLGESGTVQEATGNYWKDQNPYERFAAERLAFDEHAETASGPLKQAFENWAEENGIKIGRLAKMADLYTFLKAHGCESKHTKKGNVWLGVELVVNPVNPVNPIPQFTYEVNTYIDKTGEVPSLPSPPSPPSKDDVQPALKWEGDEL